MKIRYFLAKTDVRVCNKVIWLYFCRDLDFLEIVGCDQYSKSSKCITTVDSVSTLFPGFYSVDMFVLINFTVKRTALIISWYINILLSNIKISVQYVMSFSINPAFLLADKVVKIFIVVSEILVLGSPRSVKVELSVIQKFKDITYNTNVATQGQDLRVIIYRLLVEDF